MTREEIIQAISDDKMMPFIQPDQLAEIVDFVIKNYKPSLPSNLDEAAKKAYKEYDVKTAVKPKEHPVGFLFFDGFRAGAEWMSWQGETQEHFVIGSIAGSPCGPVVVCYLDEFEIGDEVIVQIRKK